MRSRPGVLLLLAAAAAAALAIALKTGQVAVSWQDVHDAIWHRGSLSDQAAIVAELRLPRALLAFLVGASLALSGAAFQALLRNPLADPYIVGTSAGAAVGTAVAIVLVPCGLLLDRPLIAFLGAVATMVVVYRLAVVGGRLPTETFLLSGVVVGTFLWALVSMLLLLARERLQEVIYWLMGDFSTAGYAEIRLALPYMVLGVVALLLLAHPLNLMTLGEESAFHLGVPVERLKLAVVAVASLLTAAAVSVSGLIGFVGLVVPHVVRSLTGSDHRFMLPAAALGGGTFLVLADTLSRSLLSGGQELPVGVVTALCGAPFFLALLKRRRQAF